MTPQEFEEALDLKKKIEDANDALAALEPNTIQSIMDSDLVVIPMCPAVRALLQAKQEKNYVIMHQESCSDGEAETLMNFLRNTKQKRLKKYQKQFREL
jgi:hypothetical protein